MNSESEKKELAKELINSIVGQLISQKFSTAHYVMREVIKTVNELAIVGPQSLYKKAIKCSSCKTMVKGEKPTCYKCGHQHELSIRLSQPATKKSEDLTTDS